MAQVGISSDGDEMIKSAHQLDLASFKLLPCPFPLNNKPLLGWLSFSIRTEPLCYNFSLNFRTKTSPGWLWAPSGHSSSYGAISLIDWLTGWLADWATERLSDWVTEWLDDWLVLPQTLSQLVVWSNMYRLLFNSRLLSASQASSRRAALRKQPARLNQGEPIEVRVWITSSTRAWASQPDSGLPSLSLSSESYPGRLVCLNVCDSAQSTVIVVAAVILFEFAKLPLCN